MGLGNQSESWKIIILSYKFTKKEYAWKTKGVKINKMSAFASKPIDLRSCFVEDGQNYTKVRVARAAQHVPHVQQEYF